MKMNLEVEPIDDRYSGYQYLLNVGGARIPCFATYDLREKSADRGLFLVNESDASVLLSRLTVADLASLEQVKQALVTKALHTPSAIEQVKSVVNDIYDDRVALSSASVAVHKFGPVVVSVIDSALRAECRGRQIRGRIAIYPDQVLRKSRGHRPSEMKSRAEFVRSLHEDLPRILQAYFEEIGELLYDIQHHRTQDEGVAKARNAQAVLSRSVGSKLDAILKVSPRLNKFDARATTAAANEIRDDYPDWIVTAAYTQAFIGWALAGYW